MKINKLENYRYLLNLLDSKAKKSISLKMIAELLEVHIEKDDGENDIPVHCLRTFLYANAKGVGLNEVQEKTPQNYKAEKLQQELDDFINESKISIDYFKSLGIKPIVRENLTDGNQPKEFWLEFVAYQWSDEIENENTEISNTVEDNIQSKNLGVLSEESLSSPQQFTKTHECKNDLDIVYKRSPLAPTKLSRIARLFFDKKGKLVLKTPKGITFMILLMIGMVLNWLFLLACVVLFISYLIDKNILFILLSSIYLIIFTPSVISTHKNKYRRIHSLLERKIIKAPDFLIHIDQHNAEIEHCRIVNLGVARISEITSTCPICNSKIELSYGDEFYKHYLVGRCKNAPDDHVFSFDRMKLHGFFLGHEGYLRK